MSKNKVITVTASPGQGRQCPTNVFFTEPKLIGNGSFGVVYMAKMVPTGEVVAIKTVVQDKRFRNRELGIMLKLNHCNIVKLKWYYFSENEKKQECLGLILEYFPDSLYNVVRQCSKLKQRTAPLLYAKLYMYQVFRGLAYLHSVGICHRDIKPQNLLLNPDTGVLKICDFGSAKYLVKGETNISYICSRYYRAPELLFSATEYTNKIDVWSTGCVLVELILGQPIFVSDDSVNQLVEIMKVLGTPSTDEIKQMNKAYAEYNYPYLSPTPWQEVFKGKAPPEAIDLVSRLLVYNPQARITPLQACAHKFFNKLREPNAKLLNNKELPPLFNFTEHELSIQPSLNDILIPQHLRSSFCPSAEDSSSTVPQASSSHTDNLAVSDSQPKSPIIL